MSETYKLVFRGEVLEGQHPAVVRKRLGQAAGFGDGQLDKLFSGQPVIVKREADTATATRLQAMFRKAGARLRVLPVEAEQASIADVAAREGASAADVPAAAASSGHAGGADDTFELLPAGSDLLRADERSGFEPRDVDTGSLAVEKGARFMVPDAEPDADAAGPDVSHLSVADVGTTLGSPRAEPGMTVTAPELDVAEVGAELGPSRAPLKPALDVDAVSFEVAPAGSDLGQRKQGAPPPPPDTSHLSVE